MTTIETPGDTPAPGTGHRIPTLLANRRLHAALLLLVVLTAATITHPLIALGIAAVLAALGLAWWHMAAPSGRHTRTYRPTHRHRRN